jgi:hypothetical protein
MGFNFPDAPSVGDVFPPYEWDGEKWFLQMKPGTGNALVTVGDTPPPAPLDSQFWWCSSSGILYFRFNDGSSSQWVVAAPGEKGDKGIQGDQGIQGSQGIQGPVGPGSPASAMPFTPAGNIAATNVQAALVEVDSEKVAKGGDSMSGNLLPTINGTINLGSPTFRWGTIYTADLDLNNGVGDWTIVEGEDDLFIYNNKNNKVYKFALYEVAPATAPPKKA